MKYKEVKFVSVQEWDRMVQDHYKRTYKFQQQEGCRERGVYWLEVPSSA